MNSENTPSPEINTAAFPGTAKEIAEALCDLVQGASMTEANLHPSSVETLLERLSAPSARLSSCYFVATGYQLPQQFGLLDLDLRSGGFDPENHEVYIIFELSDGKSRILPLGRHSSELHEQLESYLSGKLVILSQKTE